jgi:AraC-like DNA-binding protein
VSSPPRPSQLIYEGADVRIGRFRCAPSHPSFGDTGPTGGHLLVFPRETVTITHAGKRPVLADPTRVMLYNRGQEYRRAAVTPAGDRCEWFSLPAEAVVAALAAHGKEGDDTDRPFGEATFAPADARTYLLARVVYAHVASAAVDPLFVEEATFALLDRVAASVAASVEEAAAGERRRPPARAHRELAEAAATFLATRFAEALTLPGLARHLGTSPFHLARVFRRVTGGSLHAFRTTLRLRAAIEHLLDGGGGGGGGRGGGANDLTRLALELGFSSHSHFSAAFRAAYGVPPSSLTRLPARTLSTILKA